MKRRVVIIAGPNGAGKTTFATTFLPREAQMVHFINADLIAAGLSPLRPEAAAIRAGRLMLEEIARLLAQRTSFAFETTLSGRTYAKLIPQWQSAGYHVELIYLKLHSVQIALSRVRSRVKAGGHSVPPAVVRRRFHTSWINFEALYRPLVDSWMVYDNSGRTPILLDRGGTE